MSGFEVNSQDAWKEAFFDKHDPITSEADHQPGWQTTAIGVTLGLVALVLLSI